jgi:hypothetical protein
MAETWRGRPAIQAGIDAERHFLQRFAKADVHVIEPDLAEFTPVRAHRLEAFRQILV